VPAGPPRASNWPTTSARHVYDLARLAVGGLEPNELSGFQQRSAELMGRLMQRGL
jgi:molecular chaperone HtpG